MQKVCFYFYSLRSVVLCDCTLGKNVGEINQISSGIIRDMRQEANNTNKTYHYSQYFNIPIYFFIEIWTITFMLEMEFHI